MSASAWPEGRGLAMNAAEQANLALRRAAVNATEAGIAKAAQKLDTDRGEAWLNVAINAIQRVALERDYLTVDDVWAALSLDDAQTKEYSRQLGIAFRKAKDRGYIDPTGGFTESARPSRHRSPIRVWKSLLRVTRGVV